MKKLLALLLIGTLTLSVCACGKTEEVNEYSRDTQEESAESQTTEPVKSIRSIEPFEPVTEPSTVEEEEPQVPDVIDRELVDMGDNNLDKSLYIVDEVYKANQKNTMFSPISLNMALGLLTEGASDNTDSKNALDSYLGKDFDKAAEEYMQSKIKEFNLDNSEYNGYKSKLEIANSVWFAQYLTISDTYKNNVVSKYGAEIDNIDTDKTEESANKINAWCNEKTYGLIPSIVSAEAIKSITSAILVNSVYFEAPWDDEWYEDSEGVTFKNIDGTESTPAMIRRSDDYFVSNDNARAFGVKYKNGIEFIGILPNDEGDFNVSDLGINELLHSEYEDNVIVKALMPELNFDTECRLKDILVNTELAPIFKDSADFISMNQESVATKVDNIIQKTKIELDKYGTKAAAVTAIYMDGCSLSPVEEEPRIEEVYLDRPFAFVIYDRDNDQVLFVGKVVNME